MSTTMQLSDLITAVRQRADMVNSQFVSDTELTSYINQSYFELYDLLVQKFGDDYYVKTPAYTITTDGTTDQYALPSDFYKLLGVDLLVNGAQGSAISVKPFNFGERNRYSAPNFQQFYGVTNLRYKLTGNYLWLTPRAQAGQTIQLWYVPRLTQLVNSTDTLDGISGWTEYVICDSAIKCMQKEESDVSVLMAQKAGLIQRIESAAENRDAGEPMTVTDNSSNAPMWLEIF